MIFKSGLEINSKIEVALVDEENQIFGHSLIQEVHDDTFSIMIPVHDGHPLFFEIGNEVMISILINSVRYTFKTEVLSKKKASNINLVVLRMPTKLETADRRNLVRIKTLLPVKYEVLGKVHLENWEKIELTKAAYITDLSGKGLSISLNHPLSRGILMVLSMYLEAGNVYKNIKLLGEVVRSEQNQKGYRIGVKFLNITLRQEDLIVNYVFHCLRKSIQLNRDGY